MVKESGSAIGLAFDGDSDRLIAIDENGDIVDGDKIMYIIGKYLSEKGQLAQNTIVTTVMSNLGFHKALDREGINKAVTAVGDRYVVEEMRKSGYNLGGEQSGHVILMDTIQQVMVNYHAVQLTKIMKETGKSLSEFGCRSNHLSTKISQHSSGKCHEGKGYGSASYQGNHREDGRRNGREWPYPCSPKWNRAPFACYGRSAYNRRSGLLC